MSRHKFIDGSGRTWFVGYDNPSQGFFAQRERPNECDPTCEKWAEFECSPECPMLSDEEFDVLIGFGIGVSLEDLVEKTREHGCILPDHLVEYLQRDYDEEAGPRIPLQQNVWEMFQSVLGQ